MKLQGLLIGFIIFSLFIVTGVFIMKDINTNYAGIISENLSTSDFNDTYNTVDKLYNISQDQKDQVLGAELSDTSITESSYKGAYSALRLISGTFSLIGNIINDVAQKIGVPSYFIKFALAALTIMIIFALIGMILRFND